MRTDSTLVHEQVLNSKTEGGFVIQNLVVALASTTVLFTFSIQQHDRREVAMRHLAISSLGLVLVGVLAGCGSGSSPTQSTAATLGEAPLNDHNCAGARLSNPDLEPRPLGPRVASLAHDQIFDNIVTTFGANCGQNNSKNP